MSNVWNDQGFVQEGVTPLSGAEVALSINQGITLAGSSQATGTVLSANINVINSGSTCVLPLAPAGALIEVLNLGAAVVTPYPPSGGAISNGSTNAAGGTVAAISGAVAGVGRWVSLGGGNYVNS